MDAQGPHVNGANGLRYRGALPGACPVPPSAWDRVELCLERIELRFYGTMLLFFSPGLHSTRGCSECSTKLITTREAIRGVSAWVFLFHIAPNNRRGWQRAQGRLWIGHYARFSIFCLRHCHHDSLISISSTGQHSNSPVAPQGRFSLPHSSTAELHNRAQYSPVTNFIIGTGINNLKKTAGFDVHAGPFQFSNLKN